MKQWLKNFLLPYKIKEYRSPINGLIQIIMAFNQPRLMIDNLIQSGVAVRRIWKKALEIIKSKNHPVKQALIIGLGCGDCAFEIQKFYPEAKMVGLEIDNQVIEAAKCYFNLATVKNLKIAIEDGGRYVSRLAKQKNRQKFDLIIIDAYLGKKMPNQFRSQAFFTALTKVLSHNGVVIYNHLFFGEHKAKAKVFIDSLEKIFGKITLARTTNNLLIFAWF